WLSRGRRPLRIITLSQRPRMAMVRGGGKLVKPSAKFVKGILDWEVAEPRADAMFESMRAVGYSLEAAIADLIDNSISAGALNVWIDINWAGPASSVVCLDDGRGLDAQELKEAMRLGSVSPLEP